MRKYSMPVYFLGEIEEGHFRVKIGVAKDIKNRVRQLQTGNSIELRLLGWIETDEPFNMERLLHTHFKKDHRRGEWFDIQAAQIYPILKRAGIDGFVAKNTNAFEIVGYDRDAIPEYIGVWEWGRLEIYESCPFCGCMCGMDYQESTYMYYCLSCHAYTDFTELNPDNDEMENGS